MNKLSCEVIKDLLPSYVDGICSKESKELIEEHFLECTDCTKLMERMKLTEIVSDKINQKEFDHMKKIKRYIANKNLLSLVLLMAFIVIGIATIISNYGEVPIELYYLISPVLILSSYFMLLDHTTKRITTIWKVRINSLGLILICYTIALTFLIPKWSESGIYPLEIHGNKIGPFVYYQFLVIAVAQILIFLGAIFANMKTRNSYTMTLNISITNSCLAFGFISTIKRISTVEYFETARNSTILIFFMEGILIAIIIFILDRKKSVHKI